jgi:hypothetical protein
MEFRLLSEQNLLVTTDHAVVALLADVNQYEKVVSQEKPAVVIAFETIVTKRSNREVLVCDWPGEYEKSDVSIIGPSAGAFLASLEGKTWLVIKDHHVASLDNDTEQLNTVEGVIVWLTDAAFKSDVQKLIDHLEPAHLIYVGTGLHYGAELLPPAPDATTTLSLKSADWSATEQIIPHTLQA